MTGIYRFKNTTLNSDKFYKITLESGSSGNLYKAEWGKWQASLRFKSQGTKIYTESEMKKVIDSKIKSGYYKYLDLDGSPEHLNDDKNLEKLRKVKSFFI